MSRSKSEQALADWGLTLDDLVREQAERARLDTLIDARAVADALGCSTSQAYRVPGRLKLGRSVCWRLGDIEAVACERREADMDVLGVDWERE